MSNAAGVPGGTHAGQPRPRAITSSVASCRGSPQRCRCTSWQRRPGRWHTPGSPPRCRGCYPGCSASSGSWHHPSFSARGKEVGAGFSLAQKCSAPLLQLRASPTSLHPIIRVYPPQAELFGTGRGHLLPPSPLQRGRIDLSENKSQSRNRAPSARGHWTPSQGQTGLLCPGPSTAPSAWGSQSPHSH